MEKNTNRGGKQARPPARDAGAMSSRGRGASGPARNARKSPAKSSGWREVEKAAPAAVEAAAGSKKKARSKSRGGERSRAGSDGGATATRGRAAASTPRKGSRKSPAGAGKAKTEKEKRKWTVRSISPRTVIILILFVLFIALSASPVARNFEATGKLKAMERELAKQQKVTRSLEDEVNQARSLSYIEQEARKGRLVAPDEILYLVTTDSAEPKVEYRLKALQSMDEAWEQVRKFLHCTAARQTHDR